MHEWQSGFDAFLRSSYFGFDHLKHARGQTNIENSDRIRPWFTPFVLSFSSLSSHLIWVYCVTRYTLFCAFVWSEQTMLVFPLFLFIRYLSIVWSIFIAVSLLIVTYQCGTYAVWREIMFAVSYKFDKKTLFKKYPWSIFQFLFGASLHNDQIINM